MSRIAKLLRVDDQGFLSPTMIFPLIGVAAVVIAGLNIQGGSYGRAIMWFSIAMPFIGMFGSGGIHLERLKVTGPAAFVGFIFGAMLQLAQEGSFHL